jgi:hypothetical protein
MGRSFTCKSDPNEGSGPHGSVPAFAPFRRGSVHQLSTETRGHGRWAAPSVASSPSAASTAPARHPFESISLDSDVADLVADRIDRATVHEVLEGALARAPRATALRPRTQQSTQRLNGGIGHAPMHDGEEAADYLRCSILRRWCCPRLKAAMTWLRCPQAREHGWMGRWRGRRDRREISSHRRARRRSCVLASSPDDAARQAESHGVTS